MMRCGTGRINSAFEQVPKESANFSRQKFSKGWMKFECWYLGRLPFKPLDDGRPQGWAQQRQYC